MTRAGREQEPRGSAQEPAAHRDRRCPLGVRRG